jgi:ATP:cob(I)alamin adenosyltransferase
MPELIACQLNGYSYRDSGTGLNKDELSDRCERTKRNLIEGVGYEQCSALLSTETAHIQHLLDLHARRLFRLGSALATPPESKKVPPVISSDDVEGLTKLVHQIEATEGILADWSLAGAYTESAAYEMARTVCRRAERNAVRLKANGVEIKPEILSYLNRLPM